MSPTRRGLILLALLSAGLACNLSGGPGPVPSPNIATQVARLLTALPTLTPLPPQATAAPAIPSAPPTVTQSPTQTATPPASDPRQSLGPPDWQDTFQNGNNWDLSGGNPQASLTSGKLVFSVPQADGSDWWRLTAPQLTDFYLEGTATIGACHGLDRYGLVFRAPTLSQVYLFGFSCDGRYALRKWDGSHFTVVQDWTAGSSILPGPGQTNRLGLMAKGNRFSLYANGNLLAEVKDASYDHGRFGLFVASANTANFSVTFSQLDFWTLP